MNERIPEQLDKILAMADSSHDSEAVVAVRKARQMLSRDGLCFGDLARVAFTRSYISSSDRVAVLAGQRASLESQIAHLHQQIDDLQAQLQTQDLQLGFWRRRAMDLEQSNQHATSEADKWKKLASETADRLWEFGQSMGTGDFTPKGPMEEASAPEKKTAS